jgi:hypothetical protein
MSEWLFGFRSIRDDAAAVLLAYLRTNYKKANHNHNAHSRSHVYYYYYIIIIDYS